MTSELQTAAIGLATTALGAATVWIRRWVKEQKSQKAAAAVVDAAKVYDILNNLASSVDADRAMIFYTSNGGGIPTAGKNIYATIIYEIVRGEGLQPIRSMFQNVTIDGGFVELLQSVISMGRWRGLVKDMSKGMLTTLYNEHKVQYVDTFEIARTERFYYFGVLKWLDDNHPTTETLDLHIAAAVPGIKALVNQ